MLVLSLLLLFASEFSAAALTIEGEAAGADCSVFSTAFGPEVTDSTARIVDVENNVVGPPDAGVTVNSVSA